MSLLEWKKKKLNLLFLSLSASIETNGDDTLCALLAAVIGMLCFICETQETFRKQFYFCIVLIMNDKKIANSNQDNTFCFFLLLFFQSNH